MKIVTVSGYKAHELGIFDQNHIAITYIKKALENRLRALCENGLEWVLISGQLGVELWAAEVVYTLKSEFSELKIAILTPYLQQESHWKEETQQYYQSITERADFIDSISKRPYEHPKQLMQKNQFLLQKSDGLLLFYDEENQGSPRYMFEIAKKMEYNREIELLLITAYDINEIIHEEQMLTAMDHENIDEN
ncbi:DUF1273 domain-containing protein [Bacillus sp. JCM 19034]|uniref:DUF1273 domain-containing protein n=1 Tax=Bacillus sp. JCM 19034 TaxID=1481928 RepID=UPI000784305E|nr:DUF1273 domain-containing protein [Bacillus sp. JCM 19034]